MIEELMSFYDKVADYLVMEETSDLKYKEIKTSRIQLYDELWKIGTTRLAEKYNTPYTKLREVLQKASIPIPSSAYWTYLHMGYTDKAIKLSLPDSEINEVIIYVRETPNTYSESKSKIKASIKNAATKSDTEINDHAVQSDESSTQENIENESIDTNLYRREVLYSEVWKTPVTKVAEKYGVSDNAIRKVCRRMNIPLPTLGYWAKKYSGQQMYIPPVPKECSISVISRTQEADHNSDKEQILTDNELYFLSAEERAEVSAAVEQISIIPNEKLHKFVAKFKNTANKWFASKGYSSLTYGHLTNWEKSKIEIPSMCKEIFPESVSRIAEIISILFKYIEALGGTVNDYTSVTVRDETIDICVSEGSKSISHVLTPKEQKLMEKYYERKKSYRYESEPNIRKYDKISTGRLKIKVGREKVLHETPHNFIEKNLGKLLIMIYEESEQIKLDRKAREEAERKRKEQERLAWERRKLYDEECDQLQKLLNESEDYEIACKIRRYVQTVEESTEELSDEQIKWIRWAKKKADWYDPTIMAEDEFLGIRKHSDDSIPRKKYGFW